MQARIKMKKKLLLNFIKLEIIFEFIRDKFWTFFIKKAMGSCGSNVKLKPTSSVFKGVENFHFADDIRIAHNAVIYAGVAKIIIGNKVAIAPNLNIMTGNHRVDIVGHFMFDGNNEEKRPEDDKDVIIEGEAWIGVSVTLLSGVVIGRGSVVSAGAVVTKSCPPYSIIAGVPAKVIKYRFTIDEILEHEKLLYKVEDRFTIDKLQSFRNK
tara:strand:+ start:397 stop:1026 length:630 start_codon:yes stop_codon:yes gene_type:complete